LRPILLQYDRQHITPFLALEFTRRAEASDRREFFDQSLWGLHPSCSVLAVSARGLFTVDALGIIAVELHLFESIPLLAIYPFAGEPPAEDSRNGIIAIEITEAGDLEVFDPTGRLAMAKQFSDPAKSSVRRGAEIVDFSHYSV
jgi:hypothetical protein